MKNYDFLLPVLEKFLEQHKVRSIPYRKPEYQLHNADNPLLQEASRKTGFSPEVLYNAYIRPYEALYQNFFFNMERNADSVEEKLKAIAELQTEWCAHQGAGLGGAFLLSGQYVFNIERSDKSKRYTDNQWLVAWVVDLNLPGFPITQDSPPITGEVLYWPPYSQCLYCGLIDTDKRGIPFNLKSKFCHVRGCKSGSNPTDHKYGCCYREWRQIKKIFLNRINRAAARNASKREFEQIFLEFLVDRLKELQAKDMPSIRHYSDYRIQRLKENWQVALTDFSNISIPEIASKIGLMYSWAEAIHPENSDFWHDDFVHCAYFASAPGLEARGEGETRYRKLTEAFKQSECPDEIKTHALEMEKSYLAVSEKAVFPTLEMQSRVKELPDLAG